PQTLSDLIIAVQTRIAVDGHGQHVCSAVLQHAEEVEHVRMRTDTAPWLDQEAWGTSERLTHRWPGCLPDLGGDVLQSKRGHGAYLEHPGTFSVKSVKRELHGNILRNRLYGFHKAIIHK